MQILEMPPVVRYHAQPLCYTIGELFRVRIAQPTSVSRRNRSESQSGEQICYNNPHILIQVNCYEQFAAQMFLTLGWMSSGGTLFLSMCSIISSEWSQK